MPASSTPTSISTAATPENGSPDQEFKSLINGSQDSILSPSTDVDENVTVSNPPVQVMGWKEVTYSLFCVRISCFDN